MLTRKNTVTEFDPKPQIAIFPLACFELHEPHLPVGTDIILMSAIAEKIATELEENCFLLPTWPYSNSSSFESKYGTVSLRYQTLWSIVNDVVLSLQKQGVLRVVILNNHGFLKSSSPWSMSNAIVKVAVRQLNYEHPDLTVIWVQPFTQAHQELEQIFTSTNEELNEDAVETSLIQFLTSESGKQMPVTSFSPENENCLRQIIVSKRKTGKVRETPDEVLLKNGDLAFRAIVSVSVHYIKSTFKQLAVLKQQ